MTDQPKWTPGPWRVEKDTTLVWGNCNPDDASSWGMGFPVARSVTRGFTVWAKRPDDDEAVANAHLIAAAPDLYAALEKMGSYFPHSIVECRGDKCREPWCASCYGEEAAEEAMARVTADIAAYRAALAKARGQA